MQIQVDGRNGIRRRTYQSSVYRVSSADKKENVNVVMEGAPCLRQMYESAKHSEGKTQKWEVSNRNRPRFSKIVFVFNRTVSRTASQNYTYNVRLA